MDPAASYREDDTLRAFNGLSYDYDPVDSPDELAKSSELIISGTVTGVREGRTTYAPKNDKYRGPTSIVLTVNGAQAVQGKLPSGSDGNIYIELLNPGRKAPAAYDKAFPSGSSVVAYLDPAGDGEPREGVDVAINDPRAGRPDGQALYLPASPQGLSLQVGDHDVVWPLIGVTKPGKGSDALPGGHLIAK